MINQMYSILFIVKDLQKTANFYKDLDFDVKEEKDAIRIIFGGYRFTFMAENKTTIKTDTKNIKGVGTFYYFEVANVDKYYNLLISKNLTPVAEPKTWPWGKREFVIKDPDGYKLVFFSNTK